MDTKQAEYGLWLCGVCHVETEETKDGTGIMVYVQTVGEERKFVKLVAKR